MHLRYDNAADALTIELMEGCISHTEEIDSGTLVDLDAHGHVLAIEVIRPSRRWPLEEIVERFQIESADQEMLRDVQGRDGDFMILRAPPVPA